MLVDSMEYFFSNLSCALTMRDEEPVLGHCCGASVMLWHHFKCLFIKPAEASGRKATQDGTGLLFACGCAMPCWSALTMQPCRGCVDL